MRCHSLKSFKSNEFPHKLSLFKSDVPTPCFVHGLSALLSVSCIQFFSRVGLCHPWSAPCLPALVRTAGRGIVLTNMTVASRNFAGLCVFFFGAARRLVLLIDSLSAGRMRVLCALGGRYACVVCVRREGGMTVRFTEVLSGGLYEYVSDDVAGACA